MKKYALGTHQKRLTKALLMSTPKVCFHGEIRKILLGYPLLSGAMTRYVSEEKKKKFFYPGPVNKITYFHIPLVVWQL